MFIQELVELGNALFKLTERHDRATNSPWGALIDFHRASEGRSHIAVETQDDDTRFAWELTRVWVYEAPRRSENPCQDRRTGWGIIGCLPESRLGYTIEVTKVFVTFVLVRSDLAVFDDLDFDGIAENLEGIRDSLLTSFVA